jgi:uncharacterized repeat protein (TIGR01451 family)
MHQLAVIKHYLNHGHRRKGYSLGFSLFWLLGWLASSFPALAQPNLSDSVGQVLGCDATPVKNYTGFSIGLFHADPTTPGAVQELVTLTATNSEVSVSANPQNQNPFSLSQGNQGRFHFLLNTQKVNSESSYVLIVDPPEDSRFAERRIKLRFGSAQDNQIPFTAIALDGLPIDFDTGNREISGTLPVLTGNKIEGMGSVIALSFDIGICDEKSVQITKSSDRASVAPGDVAVYRLRVENLTTGKLAEIEINDTLPQGFQLLTDSIKAKLAGEKISINSEQNQRTVTLAFNEPLPKDAILNIAYTTEVTPDALRGSGESVANVAAIDTRNEIRVQDGPATHQMRVRGDVLSDAGTIMGRVFVDKNFDGQQQPGEPGVPNAVIILDNGREVTTDSNGLFSLTNVLPGPHTGVLDLSRLEGYTLAPNQYFIEGNSRSRFVKLPPGGTVRMNFAVTPTEKK